MPDVSNDVIMEVLRSIRGDIAELKDGQRQLTAVCPRLSTNLCL